MEKSWKCLLDYEQKLIVIWYMMVVKIKEQKVQKSISIKKKLKFEDYKNCLEVTRLENEINHLEKKKENWCG